MEEESARAGRGGGGKEGEEGRKGIRELIALSSSSLSLVLSAEELTLKAIVGTTSEENCPFPSTFTSEVFPAAYQTIEKKEGRKEGGQLR